jgi:outer membrane protein, heavy metal efflux system
MKLALLLLVLPLGSLGAQPAHEAYKFRGKVEQINLSTKRLVVSSEPVEGWMGAMTMAFPVDREEVLTRVKIGDQITAKVYAGSTTLYEVEVIPQTGGAAVAGAGREGAMRLEDLEQMALANNPTMAEAQANLRAAAGMARQVGLYPNPTVGYYGDEIRGGYLAGGKQGGFVSQTIVLGGKLGAARRVAQLQASEVETSGQAQHLRIVNDVRVSFYRALAAQRMVEVRENLAKTAGDAAQTSRQLGNVGQADRPDILQAEVEQQRANLGLRIAQKDLLTNWRMLATVAGKPDLPLTHLDGDLEAIPDLSYEEWVAATLRESPQVKLSRQALERAGATLVQARKVPIPDLQVTGILVQSNEPLETTRGPVGLQGGAQIGIQLPIFNRNQGNVAAAKAEIDKAKQELVRVKLQLERSVASMFRDYDSARVTVQQYKTEILPRAQQAYQLYQTNYQNMAGAYAPVLTSQRTLFQLEAEYVQALENAWQSALLIRGFGWMDGLSAP